MNIDHNYLPSKKLNLISFFLIMYFFSGCSSMEEGIDQRLIEKELYDQAEIRLKNQNYSSAFISLETLESRFPFGRYAEQAQA